MAIGIDDLLAYLAAALDLPGGESRTFEIGGADRASYGDLMREYARQRGLQRAMISVPFLTPRLSSLWLGLVTPVYARTGIAVRDWGSASRWWVIFNSNASSPENRGKVLDRRLWRYTRQPNYFGDATLWWGLYVIAAATPGGWLTVLSPALMTVLLMRVSGVVLLEAGLKASKPGYHAYIARPPAFWPWLPRDPR